jgi:hypothetical protein
VAETYARQTAAGLALIAVFMTSAIGMERTRDRLYPLSSINDPSLYITSGATLGRFALGFKALAADLYWMRTLQYFGDIQRGHRLHGVGDADVARREYDSLYPLLDLTTTLDPRFNLAYRFGSIFLSEPPPAGPGRPDLAIQLLEKGLRVRPDRWEYKHDIGFIYYWWVHDYIKAARAFGEASEMPGAPWWLKSLAATTLARGGDRQSSRTIFLALRESAEIDWLRHDAERRLAQLDALDAIDTLQSLVDRQAARDGHPPADWSTLVRAGALGAVPIDPSGAPFVLDASGRVQLSTRSALWPLPEEPAAVSRPVS